MKTKNTKEVTIEELMDNVNFESGGTCACIELHRLLKGYTFVSFIEHHLLFHEERQRFDGCAEWIKSLGSGKYNQGTQFLRDKNDKYCCLGVLCDIRGVECELIGEAYLFDQATKNTLPGNVSSKTPLTHGNGGFKGMFVDGDSGKLSNMLSLINDCGISFEVIADILEALYYDPKNNP